MCWTLGEAADDDGAGDDNGDFLTIILSQWLSAAGVIIKVITIVTMTALEPAAARYDDHEHAGYDFDYGGLGENENHNAVGYNDKMGGRASQVNSSHPNI